MWSPILLLAALVASVASHGRVFEPPSRSSAWRFGFATPADYDDDGANCGGFAVQHQTNGGKCGICGDAYNLATPRPHELGGTYGLGLIVARYAPGALISTTVDLTTSHKGYWQFKLCPDPESNDQACFDKHVLETEDGETKYFPTQGSKKYNVNYRLPKGVVCDHCVLQWRYTAGNNWGICANGSQGLGCGAQEQFGACSDIAIGNSRNMLNEGQNAVDDIPPPLMYYLKNGFFDAQQGVLHLLRGQTHPNKVGLDETPMRQRPQRPTQTNQQRPTQANPQRPTQNSHQRPTQTNQQRPIQNNPQRPIQTNQQRPTQNSHQKPTQNSHQKPIQKNQQRPTKTNQERPIQTNQQRPTQNQKRPTQTNQRPVQSNNPNQIVPNSRPGQIQHQNPVSNLNHSLISQLDALIKNYRDQQKVKQQNKSQKPLQKNPNQPVTRTIEITKHTIQAFTLPQGQLQQWKNGIPAGFKKHKRKRKGKGKPRKRKKKMPFDEFNRIIKVGTW